MGSLIDCLRPNERRGSKPRCHLLTHGSREQVAAALTELAAPFARVIRSGHVSTKPGKVWSS